MSAENTGGQYVETVKGHEISLTPEWVFEVTGEAFAMERPRKFGSLTEAKRAIDDATLSLAKQRKASVNLSLDALTGSGEPFVIRGINSVSSRILGCTDKEVHRNLYIPTEAVRALLRERMTIRKRLGEIEKRLEPTLVKSSRGYGNLAPEKYEAAIEALKAEYDQAAQAALFVKVE